MSSVFLILAVAIIYSPLSIFVADCNSLSIFTADCNALSNVQKVHHVEKPSAAITDRGEGRMHQGDGQQVVARHERVVTGRLGKKQEQQQAHHPHSNRSGSTIG